MILALISPTELDIVVWCGAEIVFSFTVLNDRKPIDLSGCQFGMTLTGLENGGTLMLTTDAPPPAGYQDRWSYLQMTGPLDGRLEFRLSSEDTARVRPGRDGQYRLWLNDGAGQHPIFFGLIIGRDHA